MKPFFRLLSLLLAACLLLTGTAFAEMPIIEESFELLEYPEVTNDAHIAIQFTGEKGVRYTLFHKYNGVWMQPLTLELAEEEGEFPVLLGKGENDFILREAGQPRDALGGVAFMILYVPEAPVEEEAADGGEDVPDEPLLDVNFDDEPEAEADPEAEAEPEVEGTKEEETAEEAEAAGEETPEEAEENLTEPTADPEEDVLAPEEETEEEKPVESAPEALMQVAAADLRTQADEPAEEVQDEPEGDEPADEPAEEAQDEPADEPAEEAQDEPKGDEPADEPAEEAQDEPKGDEPADEPAEEVQDEPEGDEPADEPAEEAQDEPKGDEPTEEPAEGTEANAEDTLVEMQGAAAMAALTLTASEDSGTPQPDETKPVEQEAAGDEAQGEGQPAEEAAAEPAVDETQAVSAEGEAPAEDSPADENGEAETTEEELAGEVPAEETPAEETPAEEAPEAEEPAEDMQQQAAEPEETPAVDSGEAQTRAITLWAEGNDVRSVQEALIDLGFNTGKADSVYGPRTKSAISRFQRKHGLERDGIVGPETLAKFAELGYDIAAYVEPDLTMPEGFSRTLSMGIEGTDVYALQQALIEQGYLTGKADQAYGKKTRAAVRAFQRDNDLRVDGVAGPETLRLVMSGEGKGSER